jgi:hypothetical protein
MNTQTDFEAWAKLLITRKVPEDCGHLINPEVVGSGADILKSGGAFEVHLQPPAAQCKSAAGRIFVTPIPSRSFHSYAN